jgi:hypothetical protein
VEVHKHCCYGKGGEDDRSLVSGRQQPQYPIGTVAMFGPDDQTTTKIAAGVILHDSADPIMANPTEVVLPETEQGRGILVVVDGFSRKGVEDDGEIRWRKDTLRKIGYKL